MSEGIIDRISPTRREPAVPPVKPVAPLPNTPERRQPRPRPQYPDKGTRIDKEA